MLYDIADNPADPFPFKIEDQYDPYLKQLSANYDIPYAVQGIVSVKSKPIHIFNTNLVFGMTKNPEVVWLQKCLAYLSYFNATATGNYFSLTAGAVLQFQTAQGISPTAEDHVGNLTRSALNKLFSN